MIQFTREELQECFNFAKNMRDHHKPDMIGDRKKWQIFRDDFRGKLGEMAVYKYIGDKMPFSTINSEIDMEVTPRGQWDITDIIVNNNYYNIKSVKPNGNFLLVETFRYNKSNGTYSYNNNDGNPVRIDGYILVKVKVYPDVQTNIFNQTFEQFCNDGYDKDLGISVKREFSAEIVGGISHTDFWQKKHTAPQGIRCNFKNLNHIANGKNPNFLPCRLTGNEKPTDILQTENYVIGRNDLISLQNLL